MTKTTKLLSSLIFIFLVSFLVGTRFATITKATSSSGRWSSWNTVGSCIPNSSCGTTSGKKNQTRTCILDNNCNSECTPAHEVCDKGCPTVTWSAEKKDCPISNSSYTSTNNHKECKRKWNVPGDGTSNEVWRFADKVIVNTFGPITFTYNKSDEHNKCRRPTASSLGIPSWAMSEFYDENSEWKNTVNVNCHQVPADTQTRQISCTVPYIACPSPTQTPTVTPEVTPTVTPEITPTVTPEVTPTVTPEITPTVTPEVTNSPTPTSVPNDGGNNGPGNPGAPVCNDQDPGAPTNLKAVALGGGKVKLTWEHSPGPHSTYAVAYGPSVGKYLYGDPNVGNVTTYTVLALNPGGNYCFYVQAQNGCKGGVPSNVVCTNQPGTIRVLGASDNYNPLVVGIKESYGGDILGAASELATTAEVSYSQSKLPSSNTIDAGHSISIPAIGVFESVYLPQKIGDELVVGQHEVLSTILNGANFYYGHNATDVFGKLFKVKLGDKVNITKNGQLQTYQVIATDFVSKYSVSSVKADSLDKIILMTCSYTQPDFRILVTASLIK